MTNQNAVYSKFYLTNGGNVLVVSGSAAFFLKPNGDFIREVSSEESNYLMNACIRIVPAAPDSCPFFQPIELPVWKFMWSVTDQDNSRMIESRANNGGAYGEREERTYFAAKMPNGEWKFRVKTRFYSTSEFSQTDDGRFTNEIAYAHISNTEQRENFCFQGSEDITDVIERYSEETALEIALRDAGIEITSPFTWDGRMEYESETIFHSLKFSQLKERILRLTEIGVRRAPKKKRRERRNTIRR